MATYLCFCLFRAGYVIISALSDSKSYFYICNSQEEILHRTARLQGEGFSTGPSNIAPAARGPSATWSVLHKAGTKPVEAVINAE